MTRFHIHQDITRCDLSKKACTIERARLTEASRTLTRRNARTTSRSALGSHLNTMTALRLLLRKSHFTCYSIQAKDTGAIFYELTRFWLPAILFHPNSLEGHPTPGKIRAGDRQLRAPCSRVNTCCERGSKSDEIGAECNEKEGTSEPVRNAGKLRYS